MNFLGLLSQSSANSRNVCSFIAPEATSLRARFQQGHAPSPTALRPVRQDPSFLSLLLTTRWPSLGLLDLQPPHSSLCPSSHGLPPCVSFFPSGKDTSHIGLGPAPLQYDLNFTNYICSNPSSK